MSWTEREPSFTVVVKDPVSGAFNEQYLSLTSTSTVYHSGRGLFAPLLRVFLNPSEPQVLGGDREIILESMVQSAGLAPANTRSQYIAYLDSDRLGRFYFDPREGAFPQTWIAQTRSFHFWQLTSTAVGAPRLSSGTATYDDPCVVVVPEYLGGGYLMLLTRKRKFSGLFVETSPGATEATTALTDIIAYWSDNLEFNDPSVLSSGPPSPPAVRGPLLLVDSADALPLGLTGVPFRVFVGVPSAVFHADPETGILSLYVYYAVDLPADPYLVVEQAGYHAAVARSDYSTYFAQEQGFIACKRFDWPMLRSAFSAAPLESRWTSAVEGDLLGRVRTWVPEFMPGVHRKVKEMLLYFGTNLRRTTDPAAVTIPNEGETEPSPQRAATVGYVPQSSPHGYRTPDLSLYFRAVNAGIRPPDWRDGVGLWRGSSIPDGEVLYVEDSDGLTPLRYARSTVFGVDFIVARPPLGGVTWSPDMVSPAGVPEALDNPQDPDATLVTLATGTAEWWVHAGFYSIVGPTAATPSDTLGRVIGDYEDGIRPWELAWSFT